VRRSVREADVRDRPQILRQPGATAVQIFDAKSAPLLRAEEYQAPGASRAEADTVDELARRLGIDPDGLTRTVTAFNDAVSSDSCRSLITTSAPALANSSAHPRPIPRPAPVISAIFPTNFIAHFPILKMQPNDDTPARLV